MKKIYEVSRTITIDKNIHYAACHYLSATTPTLNIPDSVNIWLRDYVEKSQKEYGVMPKEELEASFRREPGKRRLVEKGKGDTDSFRIKYDLFLNAIFYATQENLTFDLLIQKLFLQAIKKAQQQIGVISLGEMHARTDRAIEEVLKDNELKQFGNPKFTLEKTRDKFEEEMK